MWLMFQRKAFRPQEIPSTPPISSLSLWERGLIYVRLMFQRKAFRPQEIPSPPNQFPLPLGEGTDLCAADVSAQGVQSARNPEYPPISSLSLWERARVRGF